MILQTSLLHQSKYYLHKLRTHFKHEIEHLQKALKVHTKNGKRKMTRRLTTSRNYHIKLRSKYKVHPPAGANGQPSHRGLRYIEIHFTKCKSYRATIVLIRFAVLHTHGTGLLSSPQRGSTKNTSKTWQNRYFFSSWKFDGISSCVSAFLLSFWICRCIAHIGIEWAPHGTTARVPRGLTWSSTLSHICCRSRTSFVLWAVLSERSRRKERQSRRKNLKKIT